MAELFSYDYDGPAYQLFGTGHLVSMVLFSAVIAFLLWGWREPTERGKQRARLIIVSIMLANEIGWHTWHIAHGVWSPQLTLPFHLCGVGIWTTIYMLLTRDYRPYEIVFFFGIVGAFQGIITPAAGEYGWPHFRAFQTTISHSMLVTALVYLTVIQGLRPTWSSVVKTMVFLNIYLVFVFAVNYLLGSNYMFTMRKPDTASLFDVMGPWPWYLLTAEFLALIAFTLLYLPFAIADRRKAASRFRQVTPIVCG